jgi:hypothetical protein
MKKILWVIGLGMAAFLLSGCIAVCEEHRAVGHRHVIDAPSHGVVRVVPAPPPRWHGHHRHY